PEHLLRLHTAAVRTRRIQLERQLHIAGERTGYQYRAGESAAQPDPVAGAGGRRFRRRYERAPGVAVRRSRRVQDVSRRLRAGQLARVVKAVGELRAALGLVQPRTGTRIGTGEHGDRITVAV